MRIVERYPVYLSGPISSVLIPLRLLLCFIYFLAIKVRDIWYRNVKIEKKSISCASPECPEKIISIGNIEVGGTGKTPVTVTLAREIMDRGDSVVVVIRGYKRSHKKDRTILLNSGNTPGVTKEDRNLIVVEAGLDESNDLVRLVGDEALIYRRNGITVVVDSNRERGVFSAVKLLSPRFILLDDAFQRRSLYRDIDIVLLDHSRPLDDSFLLPYGYLRELPTALKRADVIIFTRYNSKVVPDKIRDLISGKPYFFASFKQQALVGGGDEAEQRSLEYLKGRKVVLFSGVAKPELFEQDCIRAGIDVGISFRFMDHHNYTVNDVEEIVSSAFDETTLFLTTEKDYPKVKYIFPQPEKLFVLKIAVEIENIQNLVNIIYK